MKNNLKSIKILKILFSYLFVIFFCAVFFKELVMWNCVKELSNNCILEQNMQKHIFCIIMCQSIWMLKFNEMKKPNLFFQILIIPFGQNGKEKIFTLLLEILDVNDMSPSFLIDFNERTFKLCKATLINGINSDIFLAEDFDQG